MTHPTDALRLVPHEKVRELAMQLARSIAGLGYPVGLGVAPPEDVCMKAAQGIFDLYLTAAPASPLPGGGWQDISTAPKDGTKVLGWAVGDFTVVEWSSGEYWTLSECGDDASDGEWWPTHWMPLPAAPTGEPK